MPCKGHHPFLYGDWIFEPYIYMCVYIYILWERLGIEDWK